MPWQDGTGLTKRHIEDERARPGSEAWPAVCRARALAVSGG